MESNQGTYDVMECRNMLARQRRASMSDAQRESNNITRRTRRAACVALQFVFSIFQFVFSDFRFFVFPISYLRLTMLIVFPIPCSAILLQINQKKAFTWSQMKGHMM